MGRTPIHRSGGSSAGGIGRLGAGSGVTGPDSDLKQLLGWRSVFDAQQHGQHADTTSSSPETTPRCRLYADSMEMRASVVEDGSSAWREGVVPPLFLPPDIDAASCSSAETQTHYGLPGCAPAEGLSFHRKGGEASRPSGQSGHKMGQDFAGAACRIDAEDDAHSDDFDGASACPSNAGVSEPAENPVIGVSSSLPGQAWGAASAAAVAAAARIADPTAASSGHRVPRPLQLSVGSIGHPHGCKPACRYVKRRGGCRDGVTCTNCHMCFWRRVSPLDQAVPPPPRPYEETRRADEMASTPGQEASPPPGISAHPPIDAAALGLPSVGTWGHPHRCGPPCKYVRRKTGCRDGLDCLKCHRCHWQRGLPPRPGDVAAERLAAAAVAAAEGAAHGREEADAEPSEGERAADMLQKLIRLQLFVHNSMGQSAGSPEA